MNGLHQYALSIFCCAMICCVIPLFSSGTEKNVLRLLCGVFLTVTVVAPVMRVDVTEILSAMALDEDWEAVSESGVSMARDSVVSIIKQESETYILDKAKALDLELVVDIAIADTEIPVPVGIDIRGEATDAQKRLIGKLLTEELGIPEEAQRWIG